jgi:hypothetical protein
MATPGNPGPLAFVVVKPPGGTPSEPPSTRNLAEWAPDPQDVVRVRQHFAGLGFRVGEASAGNFSIEGDPALFESCFGVRPKAGKAGTFHVVHEGAGTPVLPLERLPAGVRRLIHSAGFAEPPEFGPGSFR